MNFMEAVRQMRKDKKVRRKSWVEKSYYLQKDFNRVRGLREGAEFAFDDYEANDWEIYVDTDK